MGFGPLSDLFLAAHASRRSDAPAGSDTPAAGAEPARAELEACLERSYAEARSAWPGATVSKEHFVQYLARRCAGTTPSDLARMHATDLYLASACAAGDPGAVTQFERELLAPLAAVLGRKGLDAQLVEEALQRLRERLFVGTDGSPPKIVDYDGRGAMGGWLRVGALRLASNLRRDESTRAARDAVDARDQESLAVLDPALAIIQRRYGDAFRSAFRDSFASLSAEERNVLRLHFIEGLSLDHIARILGISRATAGRRMLSARTQVRTEVLRLFASRVRVTPAEAASLLAIIESRLEVSFGALARSHAGEVAPLPSVD